MSYCSNCGVKIEKEAKFCSSCGNPIQQKQQGSVKPKKTESKSQVEPNKINPSSDIKDYFSPGKNIFFGNNIPWKKFKGFIRFFTEHEIGDCEYLLYCNNTGWGSGSANGFAIVKNEDRLLLFICSYETKQVLTKVVSQNYYGVFEINNDNFFYFENNKLNIEQLDISTNEKNIFQFSVLRESKAFEELVAFTEKIKNSKIELVSNGMKVDSRKLSSIGMTLEKKITYALIAWGIFLLICKVFGLI